MADSADVLHPGDRELSSFNWDLCGPRVRQAMVSHGGRTAFTIKQVYDPRALVTVHHAAIADAQEQSHKSQLDMAAHSLCVALGTAKRGRLLELEPLLELSSDYAAILLKIQRWLDAFHAAAEAVDMKADYVKAKEVDAPKWEEQVFFMSQLGQH